MDTTKDDLEVDCRQSFEAVQRHVRSSNVLSLNLSWLKKLNMSELTSLTDFLDDVRSMLSDG